MASLLPWRTRRRASNRHAGRCISTEHSQLSRTLSGEPDRCTPAPSSQMGMIRMMLLLLTTWNKTEKSNCTSDSCIQSYWCDIHKFRSCRTISFCYLLWHNRTTAHVEAWCGTFSESSWARARMQYASQATMVWSSDVSAAAWASSCAHFRALAKRLR